MLTPPTRCLQVLVNALLSSGGGDGGVVADRQAEGRSFCEASIFNKERIRHGQDLFFSFGVQTGSLILSSPTLSALFFFLIFFL